MTPRWIPVGVLALAACVAAERPATIDPGASGAGERRPVVFVPGVTGSMLRQPGGRVEFGGARQFFVPRDGGYRLARPLDDPAGVPLVAFDLIRELRIAGVIRRPVYQPLVDLLTGAGYRLGDASAPVADESLFLFPYDWRQDNLATARELHSALLAIRSATGSERVDLVCQSNGAHICRWAARFGSLPLEKAEQVAAGAELGWVGAGIGRLVLVGASNGGSLRILREMNRGRRYLPAVGRRFAPEIFFGFPSLFLDLPAESQGVFVDSQGSELEVDLYDPGAWERFGWSLFERGAATRANRRPDLFGDLEARRAFLRSQLDRARRAQVLLRSAPVAPDAVAYHLIENDSNDLTPLRAVLLQEGDGWRTRFVGDRWVTRRQELVPRLTAPGDGHSTLASQHYLAPSELDRLEPPRNVAGGHFEMLLEPAAERYLLEVLTAPLSSAAKAASPPSRKRRMAAASSAGLSSIGR